MFSLHQIFLFLRRKNYPRALIVFLKSFMVMLHWFLPPFIESFPILRKNSKHVYTMP